MFAEHSHRLSAGADDILTGDPRGLDLARPSRALAPEALLLRAGPRGRPGGRRGPAGAPRPRPGGGGRHEPRPALRDAPRLPRPGVRLHPDRDRGLLLARAGSRPIPVGRGVADGRPLLRPALPPARRSPPSCATASPAWRSPPSPGRRRSGGLLPAAWNFRVAIHFAHRVMALVITVAIAVFAVAIWRDRAAPLAMRAGASALVSLVALQILLGAAIIRTQRNPRHDRPRAGRRADARDRVLAHLARPPRRDRRGGAMTEAASRARHGSRTTSS